MSGKSKAEAALLADNARLRKELAAQTDYIETLEYLLACNDRNLAALRKAADTAISKHCDLLNEAKRMRAKHGQAQQAKKVPAKQRQDYIKARYAHWLAQGEQYDSARTRANNDLADQLGKPYKPTKLRGLCPKPPQKV